MRAPVVIAIGIVAFVAGIAYFAPAGILAIATDNGGSIRLANIEGRLWAGRASLFYDGWPAGRLRWSFDPGSLLRATLGFGWRIDDPGYALSGTADLAFGGIDLDAGGRVGTVAVDRILSPYHIAAAGSLEIDRLDARLSHDLRLQAIEGAVSWTGGAVAYRLAGSEHRVTLPPLDAHIETVAGEPILTASAATEDIPLLRLRLDHEGWAHIGITQRFTELVGMPWPGNRPGDAVVIEVAEKVL